MNTSADSSRELLHWSSLPRTLQILIIGLVIASALLLIWASWRLYHQSHGDGWMPLMVLALFSLPFSYSLPTIESVAFMGETYLMSIAVLYGAPSCTLAAGVCALALTFLLLRGAEPLMRLHSFGSIVCGAFLYSMAYQLVKPTGAVWLMIATIALVSFLFSSFLVAAFVSWRRGLRVARFWARTYPPLFVNSALAAGFALSIATWTERPLLLTMAFAPAVIGVIWLWNKALRTRLDRVAAAS